MNLLITGSVATDHLMSFPGRFADSLVVDQLDKIALSFLVEDLEVRRGGCAANIAFGLGSLGLRPLLVGAVGADFVDYRAWLERHNVDCSAIHVSETRHTARFVCTNDATMAQIASFYAGAMSEAREIELKPIVDRAGGVELVLVGPNDPEAMRRHTQECRDRGYRFVADPSQQLAFGDGEMIRDLVDGAEILFSNEYESALITQKTGWSADDVRERVGIWVVTLGAAGVRVERRGHEPIHVGSVPEVARVEPTGVGDAFRAGFLAALSWGLSLERAAQLGCLLAVHVVEQVGTQEYTLHQRTFVDRFAAAYGDDAAKEVAEHVRTSRP
ncbi:MAG: putative Adenosine kinase [uncultured Nocardioidaceae bacterium]|uniref:Putative Adenosine kinase n=1 Tax=uncultured Nocardioidaceae bacterium TaxID=253824 RepID=A0A6J4LXV8_9ACTN|nr:MAG: putative Adenosine kinase [uncultured Nocardioidaceae bacterium]